MNTQRERDEHSETIIFSRMPRMIHCSGFSVEICSTQESGLPVPVVESERFLFQLQLVFKALTEEDYCTVPLKLAPRSVLPHSN